MPTQKNFDGSSKGSYGSADGGGGPYETKAQTNWDGGRTTKKGGGSTKPQMNWGGKSYGVPSKTTMGSHFGEKGGTGCSGGY